MNSITGSNGSHALFEYSLGGKLRRATFLLGDEYKYVVDARGKVTKELRQTGRVGSPFLPLGQAPNAAFVKTALRYTSPCTAARALEAVALATVAFCCTTNYCDCAAAQEVYNSARATRKAACGDFVEDPTLLEYE